MPGFDDVVRRLENLVKEKKRDYEAAAAAVDQHNRTLMDISNGVPGDYDAVAGAHNVASLARDNAQSQYHVLLSRVSTLRMLQVYAECVDRGAREEAIIAGLSAQRAIDRDLDYWLSVREVRAPPPPGPAPPVPGGPR